MTIVGYILLTVLMVIIITIGYQRVLETLNTPIAIIKKNRTRWLIGISLWLIYIYLISKSGILQDFSLPPRFPLLLVLPPFIFTGIFLYKHRNSTVIKAIPSSWLMYYQGFRIIIESLFISTVAMGLLHPEVTFEGYNYDIVYATATVVITYFIFNKNVLPKRIAIWWNYLGLAVLVSIIFLFTTTIYAPSVWGSTTSLASPEMLDFPFTFVPGFLMPSAVFIHITSIINLKQKGI